MLDGKDGAYSARDTAIVNLTGQKSSGIDIVSVNGMSLEDLESNLISHGQTVDIQAK